MMAAICAGDIVSCFMYYLTYKRLYDMELYVKLLLSRLTKELGYDPRRVLYAQNKQTDIIYNAIYEFNIV